MQAATGVHGAAIVRNARVNVATLTKAALFG
jgi:hypothetical protein